MKRKLRFLNFLFRPKGQLIFALLLLSASASAQEQTPQPTEFPIGSNLSGLPWRRTVQNYYDSFDSSGMNIVFQYSNISTQNKLDSFEVIATNDDPNDWIAYYATCYYTKWEAEQNQEELLRVGVKHNRGQNWEWHDTLCWSTFGIASTEDSLMYGPHYRQDNRYKSWQHGDRHDVDYYVRFNMALHNPLSADPNRVVCKIKVVYRYATVFSPTPGDWVVKDTVFLERTLRVSDFPEGGYFKYFYFEPVQYYEYPDQFILPKYAGKIDPTMLDYPRYEDSNSDNGIQFWVEWLVPDAEESGLALFIDNVEVYDRDWKDGFKTNDTITAQTVQYIQDYAANYSSWDNLKYWSGHDEPWSIDAFAPIRIVDSLLYYNPQLLHRHRLLQTFNPYWTYDDKINGDTLLCQYYRMANPEKLTIDFYPFSPSYPFRGVDAEALRFRFQLCHQLQPGFWYMGQGFGEILLSDSSWWIWRFPDSTELKTSVMLALAHGSRGILFFLYDSWKYNGALYGLPPEWHYLKGLVDTLLSDGTIPVTDLWYLIRDNLAPRLKGTLGKTLMSSNYTGVYLQLRRYFNEPGIVNTGPTVTESYLTLTEYTGDSTPPPINFHAGFFNGPGYPLNNYFMLDNLIPTIERTVRVTIEPPVSGYENYRFRNVEGLFDTTFNDEIEKLIIYPPGEGSLYQVAPVVKYGGKLIYNETIANPTTLQDEMIIKNGATLTVNATYNANADIRVKEGGRIITTGNGLIKFNWGHKLIIEGAATLAGTTSNKLKLDFVTPENSNGIIIKPGASLTISYCKIEDATIGIQSLLNANYLNAQYVDFVNCSDHSINIAGRSPGMNPTPPPQIKNCTMLNSDWGIAITNFPGMLIQENTITNTACGIYLSNVTGAQVINNQIHSNREEMQGIFAGSINGAIRGNGISGHTVGIHLANSSPDVGGNDITDCLYHGMYVGSGSNPNMVGRLVLNLGNREWYATSGYNKIYDNGGYSGPGVDNDGSEIYFYSSSASMSSGCNSIYDNRQPSPPLVNTLLLMNGYRFGFPTLQAQYNFWGDTVYAARFGNLSVNYIPYYEYECTYPDGGEDELVLKTQFGEVIDTVYSTGAEVPELTETEEAYAEAEEYFLTGDLSNETVEKV